MFSNHKYVIHLSSLWDNISTESHLDATSILTTDGDIKEYNRVLGSCPANENTIKTKTSAMKGEIKAHIFCSVFCWSAKIRRFFLSTDTSRKTVQTQDSF
jgi:hypothetical protein